MIKSSLFVLASSLFLANGPITEPVAEKNTDSKTISAAVQQDIRAMENIIAQKLEKANYLENQAALLFESDENSSKGKRLLEEAKLQRFMTLKYKAAIACRTK